MIAGFAGYMPAALWILALMANYTVIERLLYVRRTLKKKDRVPEANGKNP